MPLLPVVSYWSWTDGGGTPPPTPEPVVASTGGTEPRRMFGIFDGDDRRIREQNELLLILAAIDD